jgi:hypothetical protein
MRPAEASNEGKQMTIEEKFLNLASINMSEAALELANLRQRGAQPGTDMATVKLALLRAMSALDGVPWAGVPDAPR